MEDHIFRRRGRAKARESETDENVTERVHLPFYLPASSKIDRTEIVKRDCSNGGRRFKRVALAELNVRNAECPSRYRRFCPSRAARQRTTLFNKSLLSSFERDRDIARRASRVRSRANLHYPRHDATR